MAVGHFRGFHAGTKRQGSQVHRGDAGVGLIEVIVALVILTIATIPLAYVMTSVTQQSATARARIGAVGVAEHILEYYNNLALDDGSFPTVGGAPITASYTVGSITYQTNTYLTWGETGLDGNLCTVGSVPQIINTQAIVTWGQGNSVQESTVINPPYGLITPTSGFLAVQVNNAAGKGQSFTPPAQPIQVSLSPTTGITTPPTQVPDGGCIFVEAPAGSYTVTLSSPTASPFSYVDDEENLSTQVKVAVPPEATGYGSVAYDQGGAINVGYASQTSLADGVSCPVAGICFTLGRETTGALVLEDNNSVWSALTLPAGVSGIAGVGCLSATQCVLAGFGTGSGPVGILLGLNATTGVVTQLSIPNGINASQLTGVTCPASGSSCVVTGTASGTTGVLLTTNGTTVANALPSTGTTTVTTLNGSACSSSTQCFAVGSGTNAGNPVGVVLVWSGAAWTLQTTVPATVTAISSISCSTGASYMCTAAVTNSGAPTLLSTSNGGTTPWSPASTIPSTTLVGPLACTGQQTCAAALVQMSGATTTSIVATTVNGGTNWSASPGFPAGIGAISSLVCSSSTQCLIAGSNTSGAVAAQLSGGTWTMQTLPGAGTFAAGLSCDTTTHCVATGESATGPLAYTTGNGGSSWTQVAGNAPTGIGTLTNTGLTALGLPLTYQNVQTAAETYVSTPYTTATAADPTLIPNLFPFVGTTGAAYSAWSGDCPADEPPTSAISSTLVTPGSYAPSSGALLLPLTYLRLRMVDQNGLPMVGAAVTATVTTSGCPGDVFSLPASQNDGLVEVGLPIGSSALTYTINATDNGKSGTANISVSANGVLNATTNTTYPYPLPVPIALS